MNYPTSRTWELNDQTNTYEKCYPISHQDAIYVLDDESKTLGEKLGEINNSITSNSDKIGNLSSNGLTESDLATAIKNDRSQLSDRTKSLKATAWFGD